MRISRRLCALVAAALATTALVGPGDVSAQTQEEVDEAKELLDEAKDERAFVEDDLDRAVAEYQRVEGELADLSFRMARLHDTIVDYETGVRDLKDSLRQRAVRTYIAGGDDRIQVFFDSDSFHDVVTRQSVLERAAERDQMLLERLEANRREMERLRGQLVGDEESVQGLTARAEALVAELNSLWEVRDDEVGEVHEEYHAARQRRAAELARLRALEAAAAARKKGAGGGVSADATPGFICPVAGSHWFRNDWGNRRSGGRTHKGTDMFAARGTKVVAVGNGTIRLRSGGLGGTAIWLYADHGSSYYYAHLDAFARGMSDGKRVNRGQVIGYVGNTGNARGGAYHLHFQLHPGGGSPVNPFPTLVRSC